MRPDLVSNLIFDDPTWLIDDWILDIVYLHSGLFFFYN